MIDLPVSPYAAGGGGLAIGFFLWALRGANAEAIAATIRHAISAAAVRRFFKNGKNPELPPEQIVGLLEHLIDAGRQREGGHPGETDRHAAAGRPIDSAADDEQTTSGTPPRPAARRRPWRRGRTG